MVEIKKIDPRAVIPEHATAYSAGLDLVACVDSIIQIPPFKTAMIHTGLALNMLTASEKMVGLIVPRSGKGAKEGKVLGNLIGVIDQDYHGELMVSVWNRNPETYITVEPGEKIAQIFFVPFFPITFKEVEEFTSDSERGTGGFGSTGH